MNDDIRQTRNDVNHGGFNLNGPSYNKIISRTRELSVMLEQVSVMMIIYVLWATPRKKILLRLNLCRGRG
jgi:hypothetical protein